MRKRVTLLVVALMMALSMALSGTALAANAKFTTKNPGGQTGGCQNNQNCQTFNPSGKNAPPGQQ